MKFTMFFISFFASFNAIASVDTSSISVTFSGIGVGGSEVSYNYIPATESFGTGYKIPASFSFENMTADVGLDIYDVSEGSEFSSKTIALGSFNQLVAASPDEGFVGFGISYYLPNLDTSYITPRQPWLALKGSGTFYLGINSGQNTQPFNFNRNIFGWAEIAYSPNGLQLIRSAVTYDQEGIVVGTQNTIPLPVPEPETYAMLTVGLGQLVFMSRRRKTKSLSISINCLY